jgi:hypothetical protein
MSAEERNAFIIDAIKETDLVIGVVMENAAAGPFSFHVIKGRNIKQKSGAIFPLPCTLKTAKKLEQDYGDGNEDAVMH